MEIHYEPHPVTPERKAELRAKGLKIVDARFAPEPVSDPITPDTIAKMKKAEVIELLEAHGAEADGTVAELRKTLIAIMFVEA